MGKFTGERREPARRTVSSTISARTASNPQANAGTRSCFKQGLGSWSSWLSCPSVSGERLSQESEISRLSWLCACKQRGALILGQSSDKGTQDPWESVCIEKVVCMKIVKESEDIGEHQHLSSSRFLFYGLECNKDGPSFFLLFLPAFLLSSPLPHSFPQSSFLNSGLIRLIVGFAFKLLGWFLRLFPLSRCNISKTLFSIFISLLKDQIKVLWGFLRLFWVPVIPSKLDNVLLLFLFSSSLAFYLAITCVHLEILSLYYVSVFV